jgi:uncharacterized alpha-E superfamily protein
MLSRVADRIFWMSRQMERAENMARILGVTSNVLLASSRELQRQNLLAPLNITGSAEAYFARHGELALASLIKFLALDPENPTSIMCCLSRARENAHSVRWQITSEMWETLNATWIEARALRPERVTGAGATQFFDWVKERSHLFRGVTYGTIMRGEAFNFSRLGTFLERADNTARILDVKYHVLLPETERVGGSLDYFQWTTILREVSALTAYHWVYRESVKPWLVADLLILNRQMPRSLANCYELLVRHLDLIADAYGRRGPSQRLASNMLARLSSARIEGIFTIGLHEFISDFIVENNKLGAAMAEQYLV